MATHAIGQHKTTKNPQSLMLCGFLGLRWSLLDRYLVELEERYSSSLPQLTKNVSELEAKVAAHLKSMGLEWA